MPSRRFLRNRNRWNPDKSLSPIMENSNQDDSSAHPPSEQQLRADLHDYSSDITHPEASVGSPKGGQRARHSSVQEGASQLYYAIFKLIGFPG